MVDESGTQFAPDPNPLPKGARVRVRDQRRNGYPYFYPTCLSTALRDILTKYCPSIQQVCAFQRRLSRFSSIVWLFFARPNDRK